jgi:hypothetical protein
MTNFHSIKKNATSTPKNITYSLEAITQQLQDLGLPDANHFARAIVALLTGKKISLQHIAHFMPGETSQDANRMQLRRCLDHPKLEQDVWSKVIASLLPEQKWVLAMDRTEWNRGKKNINLLVLSVVIYDCAVPLLWKVLPNCGNSDTKERIELMTRFKILFGASQNKFLTADREFIGGDWLEWLMDKEMDFRIRIKSNTLVQHSDGREMPASKWFGKKSCLCKPERMLVWGQWVYVGGKRLADGKYLIVISNSFGDLLSDYRLRWKIETLFQALKGRGFDLESCRLTKENRLSGWLGFLALVFCWCLRQGAVLEKARPSVLKKHKRPPVSVFRRGLNWLSSLLACLCGRPNRDYFVASLALLSPQNYQAKIRVL